MRFRVAIGIGLLSILVGACGTGSSAPQDDGQLGVVDQPLVDESLGATGYALDPAQSEARFVIGEVLAGEDNTVVGATQAVEGLINLDPNNPTEATVGSIRVDVSTLMTDNNRRDGAIRTFILQTDNPSNQFAVYLVNDIEGLPEQVEQGVPYALTLSGDLTVHGVTVPTAFNGEAVLTGEGQVRGSFSATVTRQDFNLSIPNVPLVANVDEQVRLELDFVAVES